MNGKPKKKKKNVERSVIERENNISIGKINIK
jgi:hypothetical protein